MRRIPSLLGAEYICERCDRDLDAEADEALEKARSMPPGPAKIEALRQAGLLRCAADQRGIRFAKKGRPRKN
jgi:hypothetical protein